VNGQRPRGNNFLLDSTENNDIAFTGVAQPFNIADAVEEVSVQTGNFGVEFGRAGGGVFNVVTKSGTNSLHGTLLSRYQSQRFNSVSNVERSTARLNLFSAEMCTASIRRASPKNKTFFFGGFQQDTLRSTRMLHWSFNRSSGLHPSIFVPSNPRLICICLPGGLRGSASPIGLQLGDDPRPVSIAVWCNCICTAELPCIQFGPQGLARLITTSEEHRLAFRYIFDNRTNSRQCVFFPGFVVDQSREARIFSSPTITPCRHPGLTSSVSPTRDKGRHGTVRPNIGGATLPLTSVD
jgi:hypothetical protein